MAHLPSSETTKPVRREDLYNSLLLERQHLSQLPPLPAAMMEVLSLIIQREATHDDDGAALHGPSVKCIIDIIGDEAETTQLRPASSLLRLILKSMAITIISTERAGSIRSHNAIRTGV
eukprot:scaffold603909_cov41-Prasinocladus_malaysianus.AAC.1